ncbi:MAG: GNAT family N-acetyltransferase [Sedimentisphaerales bacterium]|nr:GNAT family N-acetyltransferase [Sedimentisphaerales bacterium]HNY76815.1 GNAT family N-acetyltransferase [Sedimentisphaerales bacterium]HOC61578.1 GNAT family N-acetyltransferase [Sedimentisphaerales bacterium]HOH62410.1 GNAT family N-acetyltransferase [Sedimentisphaerales bacterium]HQN31849.1 GNAT family N-acetyltransferase [Sedimentisphaerales bacterium]
MKQAMVANHDEHQLVASDGTARHAELTATLIASRTELEPYASEWNELLASSRADSIFLTWEWISTWLDTVYPEAPLCVVVVREHNGPLVAIAPFYCTDLRLLGMVKYRCLRIIGDCQSGGEYGDVIARSGYEHKGIVCVARELLKHPSMWDCMWLCNMAGRTGSPQRLTAACTALGLYAHTRPRDFGSVALPDTHDAYLTRLSKNGRDQIKRKDKRLRAEHTLECVSCGAAEEVPQFLSDLFALHRRRWESVGQAGSFVRRPAMKRFYEAFAPVALRRGWLRLYGLRVDGIIRAVQYGYAYHGVFSQLQEGYDPDGFDGAGNVLRNQVIKMCIEEKMSEYDFLGGFSEHKRRWGAEPVTGYDLFVGRKSPKTRVLFWKNVWPTGRFISEGRPASEGRSHDHKGSKFTSVRGGTLDA